MTERIPVWCKGEEWCILKSTSKILGYKWVPVITFHAGDNEEVRFNELKKEIGGITSKTLSDNLERMQERGIIDRKVKDEKPVRITYALTDFGEKLLPLVKEMIQWGRDNLEECEKEEALIT